MWKFFSKKIFQNKETLFYHFTMKSAKKYIHEYLHSINMIMFINYKRVAKQWQIYFVGKLNCFNKKKDTLFKAEL